MKIKGAIQASRLEIIDHQVKREIFIERQFRTLKTRRGLFFRIFKKH